MFRLRLIYFCRVRVFEGLRKTFLSLGTRVRDGTRGECFPACSVILSLHKVCYMVPGKLVMG